ncbi:CDK5 and ABL1 enzyme substrate 2-like [Falco cherrug]|uniref:CDK5 and ABL1 enzyme substrate 2-like n=1 Tax=Falco cherrug TaxID=345164 RepID=UPI00247963A2|nr:CDK5 and ABL1 enzyme substrate 2-like [Falco cherrug]
MEEAAAAAQPGPDADAGPDAGPDADAAAERLVRCVARALGVPRQRGAAARALRPFLRGAEGPALLAWRGPGGDLVLGPPPPPAAPRPRALFFLRGPGAGPGELLCGDLLCGDLPADALGHFAALVEEVRAGLAQGNRGLGGALVPRLHASWCLLPVGLFGVR